MSTQLREQVTGLAVWAAPGPLVVCPFGGRGYVLDGLPTRPFCMPGTKWVRMPSANNMKKVTMSVAMAVILLLLYSCHQWQKCQSALIFCHSAAMIIR